MDKPAPIKKLTRLGKQFRILYRRHMYSQLSVWNGIQITFGKEQPLIKFKIERDPPSIYLVYRIKSSEVEGLVEKFGIPPQFSLSPIQCLETDEPEYLVALNIYKVSGLVSGFRAEWSVFVRDASNQPRYMIIEAWSSTFSMDPISIFTKAVTVRHERKGNTIFTQIGEGEASFTARITIEDEAEPVTLSNEWISANDYIYWRNGICDRTFYNADLAHAQQLYINNGNSKITTGTFWAEIVEPDPVHILMVDTEIELVISPWENVERVHAD